MNYRFAKLLNHGLLCAGLALTCGGFTACSDSYPLDDKGAYPSWLGESIYDELRNPNPEHLTGTFNNYLRLVDDLGYKETLSKTGSKTVFPANDEAFARFFANNSWGVTKYEDLSPAQKRILLYGSMLDNAVLVEMLSNVSDGATSVTPGRALKHSTSLNVIDSITHVYNRAALPQNNRYYDGFAQKGIDMVMDGTRPMMVHFTSQHMIQSNITTLGANSDFEVITGSPYTDNAAYIFRNKVIHPDVTCKNGYIQQLDNVLETPGNIAEEIRKDGNSRYFSRMLDRFSAPFYNAQLTTSYNDYAQSQGLALKDSVFEKRYFSLRSQGENALTTDPNRNPVNYSLAFDPGWNAYTNGSAGSNPLSDLCALFVPTDRAMEEFFTENGTGRSILARYGKLPNTKENLMQNLDSIPINIVQTFVRDLMKPSFVNSVPSKFGNVTHDGSGDPMNITLADLNKLPDGRYNVKIGNNGVAYILDKVFVPDEWASVLGPLLHSKDKLVFYYLTQLGSTSVKSSDAGLPININFYAYLLSMQSNFALLAPTDKAFEDYYVDPASLGHSNNAQRALHFYLNRRSPYNFSVSSWAYNPATGEVKDSLALENSSNGLRDVVPHIKDLLNTHTIALEPGEVLGKDRFYLTKAGSGVEVQGNVVRGGAQIDNGRPASHIIDTGKQTNGTTYVLDHIVEPAVNSVWKVLNDNESRFSKFVDLCLGRAYNSELTKSQMLDYAGISSAQDPATKSTPANAYRIFTESGLAGSGLDRNVYFFSAFNYTVYAPNNAAVEAAIAKGLPTWDDVAAVVEQGEAAAESEQAAYKQKALAMIQEINNFVRYHFQSNSVFADRSEVNTDYETALSNEVGVPVKLQVHRKDNVLRVTDASGATVRVTADDAAHLNNKMTRDMILDMPAANARYITASSFAVVHEVGTALCFNKNGRFDSWQTAAGAKTLARQAKAWMKQARY